MARLSRLQRQRQTQTALALGLILLGPALAGLTFAALGPLNLGAASPLLRIVLLGDLVYVLVIAALILRRIIQIVADRRHASAGSRLS